ncbi:hypothetical protein [Legionella jamestowniensis]|uniref:hypothetical protein n=1 Tax=Legionella jamestowniensis TaxID=455 RepID=UPI001041B356|nr:hypothetical protein [Legionella jamestowniensis]
MPILASLEPRLADGGKINLANWRVTDNSLLSPTFDVTTAISVMNQLKEKLGLQNTEGMSFHASQSEGGKLRIVIPDEIINKKIFNADALVPLLKDEVLPQIFPQMSGEKSSFEFDAFSSAVITGDVISSSQKQFNERLKDIFTYPNEWQEVSKFLSVYNKHSTRSYVYDSNIDGCGLRVTDPNSLINASPSLQIAVGEAFAAKFKLDQQKSMTLYNSSWENLTPAKDFHRAILFSEGRLATQIPFKEMFYDSKNDLYHFYFTQPRATNFSNNLSKNLNQQPFSMQSGQDKEGNPITIVSLTSDQYSQLQASNSSLPRPQSEKHQLKESQSTPKIDTPKSMTQHDSSWENLTPAKDLHRAILFSEGRLATQIPFKELFYDSKNDLYHFYFTQPRATNFSNNLSKNLNQQPFSMQSGQDKEGNPITIVSLTSDQYSQLQASNSSLPRPQSEKHQLKESQVSVQSTPTQPQTVKHTSTQTYNAKPTIMSPKVTQDMRAQLQNARTKEKTISDLLEDIQKHIDSLNSSRNPFMRSPQAKVAALQALKNKLQENEGENINKLIESWLTDENGKNQKTINQHRLVFKSEQNQNPDDAPRTARLIEDWKKQYGTLTVPSSEVEDSLRNRQPK